jgi:phage FluMu protein Com
MSGQLRCAVCNKLLAERAPAGTVIRCPRCKAINER